MNQKNIALLPDFIGKSLNDHIDSGNSFVYLFSHFSKLSFNSIFNRFATRGAFCQQPQLDRGRSLQKKNDLTA